MPSFRRKFGDRGEALAAEFLKKKGYRIVLQNFLVREGEIDLIAAQNDELVFVEVKSRRTKTFGEIVEAITPAKEEKFFTAIAKYLEKYGEAEASWRADLITVDFSSVPPQFDHFENAFS